MCSQVVPGIVLLKGESPIWSGVDSLLYFVDIDGKAIHSYDPGTGAHDKLDVPALIGAVSAPLCFLREVPAYPSI